MKSFLNMQLSSKGDAWIVKALIGFLYIVVFYINSSKLTLINRSGIILLDSIYFLSDEITFCN